MGERDDGDGGNDDITAAKVAAVADAARAAGASRARVVYPDGTAIELDLVAASPTPPPPLSEEDQARQTRELEARSVARRKALKYAHLGSGH